MEDQDHPLGLIEQLGVLERVAVEGDEVGELALRDGAEVVLALEELGVGPGGRHQRLHRPEELRLECQLHPAMTLLGSQEI